MRLLIFLRLLPAFCCLPVVLSAQNPHTGNYSQEISFTTENDAFLFNQNDAYYTNGFFLKYSKAISKQGRKKVFSFEVGQAIYTPLIRLSDKPADIDRPYAGFLYGRFNHTSFANNSGVFQYGITLGTVGAASYGRDVQNWYHSLLDYGKFRGWNHEVQDAFGADLHFSYAGTLYRDSSSVKIMPVGELRLGTNFTNASVGIMACFGRFASNAHSVLWNARVEPRSEKQNQGPEIFAYCYPQFIVQGYNATVEGGFFNKGDSNAVLKTTSRFMYQQTIGLCYAQNRWTLRAAWVYQSREAVEQTKPQSYGSLQVGYRIR